MLVHLDPCAVGGAMPAPPSKSMAHRAVICAALADGVSHITNLEFSNDITATADAMATLCARVEHSAPHALTVTGSGAFHAITAPVDCGESGSTLRFLWPLCSLTGQHITLCGHGRLMERPLSVYERIAAAQGIRTEKGAGTIGLEGALHAGEYTVAGNVSSQFISGLLFALPLLAGDSIIRITPPLESRSYIDLTLAAMAAFGVRAVWADALTLEIPGGQHYTPADYAVEGDYSQAAFLAVLGAVRGGVTVKNLAAETGQGDAAILPILKSCGARFARAGDAVAFEAAPLHGTEINLADCPDLGPVLMVLAALCEGTTVIRNAGRLRIKESDRIAAMEQELRRFGADISSTEDTVTVTGGGLHAPEAVLCSHNDHRVVMSLAVLALAGGYAADIDGAEAVGKSWPTFFEVLQKLGARAEVHNG